QHRALPAFPTRRSSDLPRSRAMIAAGRPEAPAPITTTSAVLSHWTRACGAALTSRPPPARPVVPTVRAAPLMNFLRLGLKESFLDRKSTRLNSSHLGIS